MLLLKIKTETNFSTCEKQIVFFEEQLELETTEKPKEKLTIEALTRLELQNLKEECIAEIKEVIKNLTGEDFITLCEKIDPAKLKKIFHITGLEKETTNLSAIMNNPKIKKITDQLPPNMIEKIMQIESNGHSFLISAGAFGCMQLTKWIYNIKPPINPLNSEQAVLRAAKHLLYLFKKYGEKGAVKAYNQGENNMNNLRAKKYLSKYQNTESLV